MNDLYFLNSKSLVEITVLITEVLDPFVGLSSTIQQLWQT